MGHSGGHICQCLGRLWTLRRSSVVTVSEERPGRTGGRFVEDVLGLTRGLSEHGLRGGDVVAVAALNSDLYLEWLLAVTFIGGIVAPLNHRWSFDEARFAMEMVRPTMLVVDEHCIPWSRRVIRERGIQSPRAHVFMGDLSFEATDDGNYIWMDSLRRPSQGLPEFDYRWAPDDIALICFTSGTTGRPKGVCISHTALIVQSLAKIAIIGYGEDDVYLHTAPLCHIGGISSCMAILMAGGCHVFMPKFEAKSAINAIEKYSVTSLITVPTMVADMVSFIGKQKEWKGGCSVKKVLNGGGGLSTELTNGATQLFPNAKLLSAYGMTEACSSLTFVTLHDPILDHRRFPSTINGQGGVYVGKPAPHIDLQICIEDEINHPTQIGKIQTRGPHVLVGYWGSTSVSEKQSWFDTGDVGWLDDSGGLWLVGRSKDRIKTGGENVYPEEVEAVLCQHPGVVSAVAIGLPDTRLSEVVVACVRIRENWRWMDSDSHRTKENERRMISGLVLRKHCRTKSLTGFKIPKIFILWLHPFPLTSTGKLRRDEVRREAMSYMNFLSSKL